MQVAALTYNNIALDSLAYLSKALELDKGTRPPSNNNLAVKFAANQNKIDSLSLTDMGSSIKMTLVVDGKTEVHTFGKRNWLFETTSVKPPNLLDGAQNVQEGIGYFIAAGKAIGDSTGKKTLRLRYIQSAHKRDFVITQDGGITKLRIVPSYNPSKAIEAIEK